jgi:hypothetical protein
VLAVAVLAGSTGASARSRRECGGAPVGGGPRNDRSLPIGDIRAGGISCRTARRAIRDGTFAIHGCFGKPGRCYTSFHTAGFRCRDPQLGLITCRGRRHPRHEFRFNWSE